MRLTQPWLYIQVSVVAVCCVYCKQEKLLFTTANYIQEIDLDTLVVKELTYQSKESHSLAYDGKEKCVYSSRLTENVIVRFTYPNDKAVNFETIVSTNRPYYVAFDSGNSHLYWTELNTLGRIMRCNSDGTDVTTIVNETLPIALALNTHDRWIYYSTETSDALLRVRFDGKDRQVVINLSSRVIDIQVDFVDQRVYWMEYDTGDLKSVLYNGSDVKTVLSTYVILYNREIDIGGENIFYTSYKNILKVHKSSEQMPTVVHTEPIQIDGLLFYKLEVCSMMNVQINAPMSDRFRLRKSDEIVKFIIFMMGELNVTDVPTLQSLKNKKIGDFSWKDFVTKCTSKDGIPVWSMKPSQILKLNMAHPKISKSLKRNADISDIITHPANGKKWIEDLNFNSKTPDGQSLITIPFNMFLDDTSTHKSRRWMPLHCIQMQLSGIPIDMRQKQETIQFLGATEKADIMDVAKIIIDDIKSNRNGIETFDAANKKKCFVKGIVDCVVADFNMMSFCCNHLGATAQKYCPKCYADADHFMSLCQKRTPADTKLQLSRLNLRSLEKDKKKFRKKKGVKEHDNVMWDVLDPHRNIPVGLLHLLPLGLIKHLIQYIFNNIGENVKTKLMQHLLSIKPGDQFHDFDKHLGSRQGKDFKEYLQIAPINMLYAGVPRRYIKMATSLALIQKKLNETSFRSEDLDQIREDIREYQQLIYQYAPELTRKVKAHLLLHLVDDIERHGPPSGFLEDGFEKKHGNIRNLIFQQNQKARSRDTAFKFAQNFLCFHVLTGGYFERSRIWTQASYKVLKCGEKGSILKFLGIAPEKSKIPGRVSLLKEMEMDIPLLSVKRKMRCYALHFKWNQ